MVRRKGYDKKLAIIVLFLGIISVFSLLLFFKPGITGLVVYGEIFYTKNWSFNNPGDYDYNDSLVLDGDVKIAPIITITYWNTSTETDYSITYALYDPSDKTEKVNALDSEKHEINENKLFDMFFNEPLENGDVISLYINEGDECSIYLCDKGTLCQAPGYGSVSYDEEEGWYNMTISGLNTPTKVFNLNPSDDIKINLIESTKGSIIKALYNPSDKTSKIQNLDNEKFEVDKNKLFNLVFDSQIDNGDIISVYAKSGSASEIYLCSYGMECESPGYGSVSYDGEEGWYNITVSSLDSATGSFNLDPEKVKIDYIKAVYTVYEEHSSSNTSYPASAEIETDDLEIDDLLSFDFFSKNELLNSQTIGYQYSTDSGANWNELLSNNSLSDVSTSGSKIRIKAILSSDETNTPVLYDMAVSYFTSVIVCSENWGAIYSDCMANNTKLKTYLDGNNCGTGDGLPADNGSYVSCDYCSPNWNCIGYEECQLNNIKKCATVEDNNSCYNLTSLSSDIYSGDHNEFNLSCIYNKTGSGFSNISVSLIANEKLIINKTSSTDAILELNVSNNLEDNFVSIIKYFENKKNTSPSLSPLGKYLDIEADNSLKNSINSVKIRVEYTDEEINNANLEEESLRIYYYNETSNVWQELNSTVNTTGNYIFAEIDHLSTYGLFGEEKSSPGSGGSSDGGGHSSTRIIRKTQEKEVEKTPALVEEVKEEKTIPETAPTAEQKAVCDYDLDISLPDEISFVEKDSIKGKIRNMGNCGIPEVRIDLSPNLMDFVDISAINIESLKENEIVDFILNKKSRGNRTSLLVQGFSILNAKEIKNYKGGLWIKVVEDNNIKKEIEVPLNVKVLGERDAKNTISLFSLMSMLVVVVILFIVAKQRKLGKK